MNHKISFQKIEAAIEQKNIDKSWEIFCKHRLVESTFNKYIKLLTKYGYYNEALSVFDWAIKNKMKPGSEHYCYMIKILISNNKPDDALDLYNRINSFGYLVSNRTYNMLILEFGEKIIDNLIYDLETSYVKLFQHELNFLLVDLYSNKKFEKIIRLYDLIEKENLTSFNYNLVLNASIKTSDEVKFNKIVNEIPRKKKTIYIHNTILSYYNDKIEAVEMIKYLISMKKVRITPNETSYFSCALGCLLNNDVNSCIKLLEYMKKSKTILSERIYNCCKTLFENNGMEKNSFRVS